MARVASLSVLILFIVLSIFIEQSASIKAKKVTIGALFAEETEYKNGAGSKSQYHVVMPTIGLPLHNQQTEGFIYFELFSLYYERKNAEAQIEDRLDKFQEKGVSVVIGPSYSSELVLVQEYLARKGLEKKMIFISPQSSAISLGQRDSLFRVFPSDVYQSEALSYLVAVKKEKRVVVPVCAFDVYASDFVKQFREDFLECGENNQMTSPVVYNLNSPDWVKTANSIEEKVVEAIEMVEEILEEEAEDEDEEVEEEETSPRAKVAVLFKGFEEVTDLFTQISDRGQYPTMTSVEWFGTDSSAQNLDLVSSPAIRSVAISLNFTSSTVSLDHTNTRTDEILELLEPIVGGAPPSVDVLAYDALLLAVRTFQATGGEFRFKFFRKTLRLVASTSLGLSGPLKLDNNDDKLPFSFDFFKIDPVSFEYRAVATYPKISSTLTTY